MKKLSFILIIAIVSSGYFAQAQQQFRAPAYPLITVDPYFSIWSFNDTLNAASTVHWTGKENSLQGIVRVDGKAYYFMGSPIPQYSEVLPMAAKDNGMWKYTFSKPDNNWSATSFDAADWKTAAGAFSDSKSGPGKWTTTDIWIRRSFNLKNTDINHLLLKIQHDDGATVYLNGVLACKAGGAIHAPVFEQISPEAQAALKKGRNVLAIHCVNTGGQGYINAGLTEQLESKLNIPKAEQTNVKISATQTFYQFKCGGVDLQLTFTDPLLPEDLDIFSRPADYISFKVHSLDGQSHKVQLYFSAAGNIAVNTPDQEITWKRSQDSNMDLMRVGTTSQNILGRKGDDVRIDWGYLYLAIPKGRKTTSVMASSAKSVQDFANTGMLTLKDDNTGPRPAGSDPLTLAAAYDLGTVSSSTISRHLILAYDDIDAIEYFHQKLKAWWKRKGTSTMQMLSAAEKEYKNILQK